MRRQSKRVLHSLGLLAGAGVLLVAGRASANGFEIPENGTEVMGRGGGSGVVGLGHGKRDGGSAGARQSGFYGTRRVKEWWSYSCATHGAKPGETPVHGSTINVPSRHALQSCFSAPWCRMGRDQAPCEWNRHPEREGGILS